MTISALRSFSIAIVLLVAAPWSQAQQLVNANYPGAAFTSIRGINNLGVIVGQYQNSSSDPGHAFLLSHGTFTNIDDPAAAPGQAAQAINDSGDIVGTYLDPVLNRTEGFLLIAGIYTTIAFPGSMYTQPYGINNSGQIVGLYTNPDGNTHGFLLTAGSFSTIDFPGPSIHN